jgi:hypothetical protein
LLVEDWGVLVSEQMTRAEREMLTGLVNVVQRIDGSTPLRYLTAVEVSDVLHGGSDHYRQTANNNSHSQITDVGITGTASGVRVAENRALLGNL